MLYKNEHSGTTLIDLVDQSGASNIIHLDKEALKGIKRLGTYSLDPADQSELSDIDRVNQRSTLSTTDYLLGIKRVSNVSSKQYARRGIARTQEHIRLIQSIKAECILVDSRSTRRC